MIRARNAAVEHVRVPCMPLHMIAPRILHLRHREPVASPGGKPRRGQFGDDRRMGRFRHGRERRKDAGDGRRGAPRSQWPDQAAARRENLLRYSCSCRGWWSFLGGARGWGGQCASASAEKYSSSLGSGSRRTWRPERRWRLAIQLVRAPGVWAVCGGAKTWDGESSSGHGQPGLVSGDATETAPPVEL
jgi:hypothetical protein